MCWKKIKFPRSQLQLETTLLGGQSFRWKKIKSPDADEYVGVFANIIWRLKQNDKELHYKIEGETIYSKSYAKIKLKIEVPEESENAKHLYHSLYYENLLRNYFRLNIDLNNLYKQWCTAHSDFNNTAEQFFAVRMLNQDPVENLISFICSQNNHIKRISMMVQKICELYGEKIGNVDNETYYTFPDISKLADLQVEQTLRDNSFGYRAKYISTSAKQIMDKGGIDWFQNLEDMSYKEAKTELSSLCGIGPKVADCICLMSLNHLDAIPVDTHVFQIAKRYMPELKTAKSVTPKMYDEIGNTFRKIYGSYAGWAQIVLFCSDLRQFQVKEPENNDSRHAKRKKTK